MLDALDDYLADFSGHSSDSVDELGSSSGKPDDQKNRYVWGLLMCAVTHIRRIYELDYGTHNSDYFRGEEQSTAQLKMNEAKGVAPTTWQGLWCLAAGLWMAGGGHESNENEYRLDWLEEARTYVAKARKALLAWLLERDDEESGHKTAKSSRSNSPAVGMSLTTAQDDSGRRRDYLRMMDQFEKDVQSALQQEETAASRPTRTNVRDQWSWIDELHWTCGSRERGEDTGHK